MITIEEEFKLEADIIALKQQLLVLKEGLLSKERELWWLQRPHIADFANEWYYESTDDGGHSPVWRPHHVDLSKKWLSIVGNQAFIDRQLFFIAEKYESDCDEGEYPNHLICGLGEDIYCEYSNNPYPNFVDAPDTVRNPNYAN